MKKNDEYPKFICFDCTNQLKNSYNFRQLCLTSFDKLKEFIVVGQSESPDFHQNDLSSADPPVKLESFLSVIVDDDLPPASSATDDNAVTTSAKRKHSKRKARPKSSDSVQSDDGDHFDNQSFDEQSIKDESFVDPFDEHIRPKTDDIDAVKTAKKRGRKSGSKKETSDDAAKSSKKIRGKYKKREKSKKGEKVPKERSMQICPICGEQRLSIENHMLTMHTDEKPCCCEICGKWIKSNCFRTQIVWPAFFSFVVFLFCSQIESYSSSSACARCRSQIPLRHLQICI